MIKIIYDSTKNSDMMYVVKQNIFDPFLMIDSGKIKYIFLDFRDYEKVKKENKDRSVKVVSYEEIMEEIKSVIVGKINIYDLIYYFLKKENLHKQKISVQESFSISLYEYLIKKGLKIKPAKHLYPERFVKNNNEIEKIKDCVNRSKKLYRVIESILKDSTIKNNFLIYDGKKLTSEFIKSQIEKHSNKLNLEHSERMIISCANDSAIPHHEGSGCILPHQPIICDLYPKDKESNYFSDMTRTYVKGKPSNEFRRMYKAVLEAQTAAIKMIKPGVKASDIHNLVLKIFSSYGYFAKKDGFAHSTGHGLGLDIHEYPNISASSKHILQPGNVITIEPGLYFSKIGGVRIEDLILVTKNGYENLTNYKKSYLIK